MNVPLKKRHNYGKINGSASSLNDPSVKRVHSSYSNYEDSDYEQQSSNMDESLQNGPATLGRLLKDSNAKPHQYLSIGHKAVPADNHATGNKSTGVSSSSSVILSSSASNHDSSERNDDEPTSSSSSSSDSDSSTNSHTTDNKSEMMSDSEPLTEDALMQHNTEFEPMNSQERIQFWNIADEFSDIEDDFDDEKHFSKPIRSERLQKRMYKKPAPVTSTSKRIKKEEKSHKTDEKPISPPKKPKEVDKPLPKVSPKTKEKTKEKPAPVKSPPIVLPPIQPIAVETVEISRNEVAIEQSTCEHHNGIPEPMQLLFKSQLVNSSMNAVNSIVETRPADEIPSTIKFRINYNKNTANCSNFKIPTTPNTSRTMDIGCANCNHTRNADKLNGSVSTTSSSELPIMANNNREEFYKYLRIDTNPTQEKTSPEPSPTDTLYNHRRSLRVFIQQRQYEFTKTTTDKITKDDQSPDKPNSQSSYGNGNSPNADAKHDDGTKATNSQNKSPENGKLVKRDEQSNGNAKQLNTISSNIKQRRSYEPSPTESNEPNVQNSSSKSLKETENIECDDRKNAIEGTSNGEGSGTAAISRIVRMPKRKIILPSPMMLTEMFKRYKQCFRQGFAVRQHLRQQSTKRPKKRLGNVLKAPDQVPNGHAEPAFRNDAMHLDDTQPTSEDLINTFSPTSITHSNASTDSAIVVNSHINELCQPKITLTSSNSLQWHQEQINHIDKSQFRNPLDPKHGAVHAILTHSTSPNSDDVIVVVQKSQISYWYSTSKTLSMFGIARSWIKIGDIQRIDEDKELDALYQHRLMNLGEPFPVYVEMRARESGPDEYRQSNLTFVYLNVYYMKTSDEGHPRIVMERVNLDTLKGYADSVYYTALKTSPSVLMTWTEHNVNNQTRCGIVKYTLKIPTLDNIEDIFDYSYLQHDIKTLYAINDYHVVGCGDRSVSLWDHRNGNLLIDIEIELPTIGYNIGCYTVGDDVPEYMLLIQLASVQGVENCNQQLKVMAVQTVDPFNYRTLQTHNIPKNYGKVRSIFNNDDMLLITFSSGTMLFLNISSPHTIYMRNKFWPNDQKPASSQLNGVNQAKPYNANKIDQMFAQCNGQIIELTNDHVITKSIWEYFVVDH